MFKLALPVQRTYSATPAALNTPIFMTDQQSLQTNFLTLTGNTLQDLVNLQDPAAGLLYEYVLVKNGNSTSIRAFSSASSATTSGRVPIGVVNMSPGSYQWQLTQTAGAVTAQSILVRYGNPLN